MAREAGRRIADVADVGIELVVGEEGKRALIEQMGVGYYRHY